MTDGGAAGRGLDARPRLRHLEAFPVDHEGRQVIALRDPAGFVEQVVLLPGPLLDLVSLFDGEHSIGEIRAVLARRDPESVPTAGQIAGIAAQLDAGGFLDSEAFAARRARVEEAFRRSPLRPAVHAGGAYAGEPQALRRQIDAFYAGPGGPGRPRASPAAAPRGVIAPHIDFHRGGTTYGWAYRAVADAAEPPELFVILGTCHAGMPDPFAITLKAYDTPFGPAPVDLDFCDALQRRYGHDLLASEPAHRAEHSIEFQAVMLRHALGDRPFAIVPVLASYLHEAVWSGGDPEGDRRVPRFIDALAETIATARARVCLVAGVDLSHVGPRFGDGAPNTAASLRRIDRDDRAMLEAVTAGDARGFYASVARDGDARRICGLSPIYSFLRALPGATGRLERYSQWPDPQGAVTFCAAVFS